MFSRRTAVPQAPNALARALAARTRPMAVDLTLANPTWAELPYEREGFGEPWSQGARRVYEPEPRGLRAAREAIAEDARAAGLPCDPDRLFLTSGTSEAFGWLFQLLCDPGDEVLVPRPGYPLLEHLAMFEGVVPVPYPVAWDGRWHLDLEALRRARTARTRAVVVVHPNNPTGSLTTRDEHAVLAALGLPIVSDEVFARYPLSPFPDARRTLLCPDAPLTFALGGLSKAAAEPGLKCGWIALDGERRAVEEACQRLELLADTRLSVSTPLQHALGAVLRSARRPREAIQARLLRNAGAIAAALGPASPVEPLRAEGGWSAILRLPAEHDSEGWALRLLDLADVLVHPGSLFDLPFPTAVVSLLVPEAAFREGLERLGRLVRGGA